MPLGPGTDILVGEDWVSGTFDGLSDFDNGVLHFKRTLSW